jgi:hypothetical protein
MVSQKCYLNSAFSQVPLSCSQDPIKLTASQKNEIELLGLAAEEQTPVDMQYYIPGVNDPKNKKSLKKKLATAAKKRKQDLNKENGGMKSQLTSKVLRKKRIFV